MINRKGQIGLNTILGIFMVVVIGLALYSGGISSNVGALTSTYTVTNTSITLGLPGTNNTLVGQAVSGVIVTNVTSGAVVPASNYTITNYELSTGTYRALLTVNPGLYNGSAVNISYTYEPLGYLRDSGSRGITALIGVFLALAIIGTIIAKLYDGGVFDKFTS